MLLRILLHDDGPSEPGAISLHAVIMRYKLSVVELEFHAIDIGLSFSCRPGLSVVVSHIV